MENVGSGEDSDTCAYTQYSESELLAISVYFAQLQPSFCSTYLIWWRTWACFVCVCVASGKVVGRPSGCLGDFVGSSPTPPSPSGPLFLGLPQSSLPAGTPRLSLLQELSTAVIWVHRGTGISQFSGSSVVQSVLPPPSLPPARPHVRAGVSERAQLSTPATSLNLRATPDSYSKPNIQT